MRRQRGLQHGAAFEAHFDERAVKLAAGLGDQPLDGPSHRGRGRKHPIAQALAGAAIDVDAVMAGHRDLVDRIVGQEVVERSATEQIGNGVFGQRLGLEPDGQREDLVGLVARGALYLGAYFAELLGRAIAHRGLVEHLGHDLAERVKIASALRIFRRQRGQVCRRPRAHRELRKSKAAPAHWAAREAS